MKIVGEIEPKPGIPPTSRHIEALIESNPKGSIYEIIADAYHEQKTPRGLSQKMSVPWVVLPQDVSAVAAASDIFTLFDTMLSSALR
jgi:zinc/manganese transport system substrate-binding protein